MNQEQTISVGQYKSFRALRMTWGINTKPDHIQEAFVELNSLLNTEETSVYVVVDLRASMFLPLLQTFRSALRSHQHPNLKAWLVIGENKFARAISDMLELTTRTSNIQWYQDEATIDELLQEEC